MHDTSVDSSLRVRFRPTWQQALARGLCLGALGSAAVVLVNVVVAVTAAPGPSARAWALLVVGPLVVSAVLSLGVARFFGTDVDSVGIHPVPGVRQDRHPWDRVVDLRAERYRGRTVVAVYLDCGAIVHLRAPYDGEFMAVDSAFERKLFTLSHLWRIHRIGGAAC